ncbi:MAG: aminopeptidase P family protein [Anaerolineaceae bacterium]|nr:aminopeptidase P family protein [Anaerolineaceae bacterium]MCB9099901.1 aminopeptidase P family protein [Anaerolineales bacterium]
MEKQPHDLPKDPHSGGSNRPLPPRGFPVSEFEHRLSRAQRLMNEQGIAALLLTTEPEIRYFSGFLTQFWQSPTRPWFMVVPFWGKPIAVIPEIGAATMAATWLDDIRTWPSPAPEDDGISLLAWTLLEVAGHTGRVGLPIGPETHLRMPLADFEMLRTKIAGIELVDATSIIQSLRLIKSEAEIAKIAAMCDIASDVFDDLPHLITPGDAEEAVFRTFKIELLRRGADDVPYLVGGAGPGGYEDIISPPSHRPLQRGDVLMLDTGSVFDGYYCDFDRNFAIDRATDATCRAYETLYRATEAGLHAAHPGATCADIFASMWRELSTGSESGTTTGRLGHGLGMQLTEWPSLTPADQTVLQPGMVITLEPGLNIGSGRMMVHEENIVIRGDGAELLTRRAPAELPVIRA